MILNMNAKLLIICFLCLCQSFLALTNEDCEFLRPPKAIKRVSNNPSTPFRIRFTLKHFEEFCLMKVRIPSNAVVTFNLTRSLGENKQNQPGDKLHNQIFITNNMKTLMIVNVAEEFGSRFGRYQLNQREVYGVPYHESIYRPILDGYCRRNSQEDEGFDVSGKLRTSATFRRCLRCNREKGKQEEDYLFCHNCKTKPTLSEDSQELSFAMEDVNETEQYITCQIKTEDDRVNYILRFVPSCASSRSSDAK